MKVGDIVRNWWAGKSNPNRCYVYIGAGRGLTLDGRIITFDGHENREVIGYVDLDPLRKALEEHAIQEARLPK